MQNTKLTQKYLPTRIEKIVLELVMRKGRLTQSQLVEQTGITQQYLSKLTAGLSDKGLIRRGKKTSNVGRGQPGTNIEINPSFLYSFGVCIISDAISISVIDFAGNVVDQRSHPMQVMDRKTVIDKINSDIDDFKNKHQIQDSDIAGLGVGISGYATGEPGAFNPTAPLDDWALVNLEEILGAATNLPTWAENDGNVAALGENMRGVGRWADNFVYIYLTYGFGGGIIMNGKLQRGQMGNAGELRGTVPYSNYEITLESLRLTINAHGNEFKDVNALLESFDINLPGVEEWIFSIKDTLIQVFRSMAAILDPAAIVLGGQIPRQLGLRLIEESKPREPLRRGMTMPSPKIVLAESVGDAGAIGAAILPLKSGYFD
jgi:predicted NBD/HSP70 family sugar kinase